jgi:hypothetical protein
MLLGRVYLPNRNNPPLEVPSQKAKRPTRRASAVPSRAMDANQLRELETLCRLLYESGNDSERAHAQQAVLILQSSAEYIPQCQYVLDHSSSPYALLVASTSLTKLITSHWNNFTTPQRVDIRAYSKNCSNVGPKSSITTV